MQCWFMLIWTPRLPTALFICTSQGAFQRQTTIQLWMERSKNGPWQQELDMGARAPHQGPALFIQCLFPWSKASAWILMQSGDNPVMAEAALAAVTSFTGAAASSMPGWGWWQQRYSASATAHNAPARWARAWRADTSCEIWCFRGLMVVVSDASEVRARRVGLDNL